MLKIYPANRGTIYVLKAEGNYPKHMNTERAIELSIEKWETIVKFYEERKDNAYLEDGGIATCALCFEFYYGENYQCEGCPIADMGHETCNGTPYELYADAAYDQPVDGEDDHDVYLKCAREELRFLKEMQYEYLTDKI